MERTNWFDDVHASTSTRVFLAGTCMVLIVGTGIIAWLGVESLLHEKGSTGFDFGVFMISVMTEFFVVSFVFVNAVFFWACFRPRWIERLLMCFSAIMAKAVLTLFVGLIVVPLFWALLRALAG